MSRFGCAAAALLLVATVAACGGGESPATAGGTGHPSASVTPAAAGTTVPSEPSPTGTSAQTAQPSPDPTAEPTAVPAAELPTAGPWQPYPSLPRLPLALPAAGAPETPAGVKIVKDPAACTPFEAGDCASFRAVWQGPEGSDVTIRVYAVTRCIHLPIKPPSSRCIQNGDIFPTSSLTLLGTAPAGSRSFAYMLIDDRDGYVLGRVPMLEPRLVYGILIQAVNDKGGSLFAIADSYTMPYGPLA